jgi:hypothetical protein
MNRLESLEDKKAKANEFQEQIQQEEKDFVNLGRMLFKTKEGKQFFLLAKKIYYNQNEYLRDTFYYGDPNTLARLNGEDYILRKLILQFINQNGDNDDFV